MLQIAGNRKSRLHGTFLFPASGLKIIFLCLKTGQYQSFLSGIVRRIVNGSAKLAVGSVRQIFLSAFQH